MRALLTREGIKARDFVDVYLIWKKHGIKPEDEEKSHVFAIQSSETIGRLVQMQHD